MLLTLVRFRLKRVPEPERGTKSFENAEIRRVRIAPLPGRTLAETFQFPPVRPAGDTGVDWKVTIVESKVKSPWNPTRLLALLIIVVATGCEKSVIAVLIDAVGNETIAVTGGVGVGVGVGVGGGTVAVAVAVAVTVAVGVGDNVGLGVGVKLGLGVGLVAIFGA